MVGVVNKNVIVIEGGKFCIKNFLVMGILLYLYIGNINFIKLLAIVLRKGLWGI